MDEATLAKKHEWTKKIDEWQSSGKTISSWCLENNIVVSRFQYWRKRLGLVAKRKISTASSFIELPDTNSPRSNIELQYKGATFLLSEDFDETILARTLRVLRDF